MYHCFHKIIEDSPTGVGHCIILQMKHFKFQWFICCSRTGVGTAHQYCRRHLKLEKRNGQTTVRIRHFCRFR